MAGNGWSSRPLGELCDQERGITYGIVKVGDFVPGGVPVIRGGDIRDGRIEFDDAKRVTEEVSQKFKRTILRGGEIILNLIAEPGHSAIVPSDCQGFNVSRDVAVIPLSDEPNLEFVNFFLRSRHAIQWLTARLQGSVTQKINLGTLRELPIPTPPRPEQDAIAEILGALDAKIELNRRMNETLESLARSLFKSWFVDFDPVRAKMDGRPPPGFPLATAALFPDKLEHQNGDLVPCGWQVAPFSSLFAIPLRNGVSRPKRVRGTGTHMVNMGELFAHRRLGDVPMARVPLNESEKERLLIEAGDILFARQSLVLEGAGQCSFVTPAKEPRTFESHLIRCRIDTAKADPLVWFYYFMSPSGRDQIASIVNHTAAAGIRGSDLSRLPVVIPPRNLQACFGDAARNLETRISSNESESRTLAALRDTLLPRLLSGELRVADVPAASQEALVV